MILNTSKPKEILKKVLQTFRLLFLANKDIIRFAKSASFSVFDNNYNQICARIIYNVHSIEKGLSRSQDFRPFFGKKALSNLNDSLVIFEKNNYDKSSFAYIQGRSIIKEYIDFHEMKGLDIKFLESFVNKDYLDVDSSVALDPSGVKIIKSSDKLNNSSKSFYELARNRSSVRDFSGESIDKNKIFNALKIAEKTPSVCNRQGWRVYLIENKKIIEEVLAYQHGFNGYPCLPEYLLSITVSNNSFLSPVERNEAFVDGGLFSMSVIYGLEYEGLAAVTLNAMMNSKDENMIRKTIGIDSAEQIILFIAVGAFKESCLVPISERIPANQFTKLI